MKTEGWILKALASVQISLNREMGPGKESSEVHSVTNCLDLFLTDCHVPHCRSFRWVWSNRSRILPLLDSFMFFPHSFIHYYSPPSHWLHIWIASVWSHSFENYLSLYEFFCFLFQYAVTTQWINILFLPLFYIYKDIHNYFLMDVFKLSQVGWEVLILSIFPKASPVEVSWRFLFSSPLTSLPATAAGSHPFTMILLPLCLTIRMLFPAECLLFACLFSICHWELWSNSSIFVSSEWRIVLFMLVRGLFCYLLAACHVPFREKFFQLGHYCKGHFGETLHWCSLMPTKELSDYAVRSGSGLPVWKKGSLSQALSLARQPDLGKLVFDSKNVMIIGRLQTSSVSE